MRQRRGQQQGRGEREAGKGHHERDSGNSGKDAHRDGAQGAITLAMACRIVACWPSFVAGVVETLQSARR